MPVRGDNLFSFPNPVNEVAARLVAGGVVAMSALALGLAQPWFLVPLAYGFWARVLTGPTLSPLGQLATRFGAKVLPFAPRPVPGPPKRFAQGIGAVLSTAALLTWLLAGWSVARFVLLPLIVAAGLESVAGFCLGCRLFAVLMAAGLIPERICLECADLSRRHAAAGGA
jgi:hypothetical protein